MPVSALQSVEPSQILVNDVSAPMPDIPHRSPRSEGLSMPAFGAGYRREGMTSPLKLRVPSVSVAAPIARDRPIMDSDVQDVALGGPDRVALLKRWGGSSTIEDESGRQLVHSWDDPILDVAWQPSGRIAYLVRERFFDRLEVRDQDGQKMWDDFGSLVDPRAIAVGDDGELYFRTEPHTITDDRGFDVYRGWRDERIDAFQVVSNRDCYVVVSGARPGRDWPVLKDSRGRRLFTFQPGERVEAIAVRGKTLTYVSRRDTDLFRWVRTVPLR